MTLVSIAMSPDEQAQLGLHAEMQPVVTVPYVGFAVAPNSVGESVEGVADEGIDVGLVVEGVEVGLVVEGLAVLGIAVGFAVDGLAGEGSHVGIAVEGTLLGLAVVGLADVGSKLGFDG